MCIGFALASVGMDTVTGHLRLTFGSGADARLRLPDRGHRPVRHRRNPAVDGRGPGSRASTAKIDPKVVLETWKPTAALLGDLAAQFAGRHLDGHHARRRHAGFVHGYGLAKKMSKRGAKFGTGEIEGVLAPETAAHAAGTSALLPMLALGIPGSPTAAVLLGGLLIWGLQPGPLLFVEQKDFVWGLIASMYLGNLVGLIVVLARCRCSPRSCAFRSRSSRR
jgi:putative tricarboxylic transport membrane protein